MRLVDNLNSSYFRCFYPVLSKSVRRYSLPVYPSQSCKFIYSLLYYTAFWSFFFFLFSQRTIATWILKLSYKLKWWKKCELLTCWHRTLGIMHPNDRVMVASRTGHVIIIYDGHLVSSQFRYVLAWRSLETLEDLLFLAPWRAKKNTGPLNWNRYKNGLQNRTQEIQGTCNKMRMARLMWITTQCWLIMTENALRLT